MIPLDTKVQVIYIDSGLDNEDEDYHKYYMQEGIIVDHYAIGTDMKFNSVQFEDGNIVGFTANELSIVDEDNLSETTLAMMDKLDKFHELQDHWKLVENGISKVDFFNICKKLLASD